MVQAMSQFEKLPLNDFFVHRNNFSLFHKSIYIYIYFSHKWI